MPLRVATLNLNFSRPDAQPASVARALDKQQVDILCVQENRVPGARLAKRARVVEGRQPESYSSQAVVVARKDGLKIRGRGSRAAFANRFGQKIDWRRHVWAIVTHPDLDRPLTVVSVHVPPRYMWRTPINALTAMSLRRLVRRHRRRGRDVVVGMDGNYVPRKHGDPLRLKRVGLRKIAGDRIDHLWATPGIVRQGRPEQYDQPGRHDDHPLVVATIRGKRSR